MAMVLVVDDEFGIGEVLESVLTDAGHDVVLAVNGKQALAKLAEDEITLVISDLMMPVMDGATLFAAIRGDPALDGVKFVLMSSLPESAAADKVTGYDAFLRKPFRIPEVMATVTRLFSSQPE